MVACKTVGPCSKPDWRPWALALDVGEASIGWAAGILEEDGSIRDVLNAGVRLFEGAWRQVVDTFKAHGVEDRIVRGQQRRFETRRRRLAALVRLFANTAGLTPQAMKARVEFRVGDGRRDPVAVFALRARAAREPLALEELFQVAHHMAAHRGVRLAAPVSETPSVDTSRKAKLKTKDEEADDDSVAQARTSERLFRNRMAAALRADGSTPTCGEILFDVVREDRKVHGRSSQPLIRARTGGASTAQVIVPTRALIAEEFDRIRAIQEAHHQALDWNALRALVLDQQPIALPPAAACLFLGELIDKPFRGWIVERAAIDRGLANDPLMQALRIREAVGNLRIGIEQDGPFGKRWEPRTLEAEGLLHGELTAAEREILVDTLLRLPSGIRTDSRGYVTYPALRRALGLDGKERFGIERDDKGGGLKPNPTDPVLARWIPGWFGHPVTARSLYYRDLVERRADSRLLREYLGGCRHGIGPVPPEQLDDATATLLESDLFDCPLYSVCHIAAEAILAAWAERPTAGFYTVTRDLFGFAPNEIVLGDLSRARARLHETLPYLDPRTPGARRADPLKDCTEVIPSQLVTTLRRGHKGRGERAPDAWTRLWTGNAATNRILSEVRKVANAVVNRYGGRLVDDRPLAPLPTTITIELAREAKHGVTRRQEIHERNRKREELTRKANKHLDDFCRDRSVDWTGFGIPRERAALRLRLAERQACHCPFCDRTLQATDIFDPASTEIDHVIERGVGGDSPDNLVLAHKECNNAKGKRTPHEFLGMEVLDHPALLAMWRDFRASNPADRGKGKKVELPGPFEDKDFMDRIGWRFTADARALSEERGRRQGRLLHDTARASRLARLYLTALVLPENPGRLGAKSTEEESTEELYRALARVRPVNGSVTAMLRRRLLQSEKDRDSARHHAEDACLLLLAGPAVVQAFNTEAARKDGNRDGDQPQVDVGRVADEHHLRRLRRRVGRVALPSLDRALDRWVRPGARYDGSTGRETWIPTAEGKRLRNRIRDLVAKAPVEVRTEKPCERGTPGGLHDDNPYGRTDVVGTDGTSKPVFHKRRNAGFLVDLISGASDAAATANPNPGALVGTVAVTEVEHLHDRVFDPQERFRSRWKSTRMTALVPDHAAAVLAEMAELAELDAIPDRQRTPEQEQRRKLLGQSAVGPAVTGRSEAARIRAREAEILRRVLADPHWGPRGLRGLSIEEPKVKPVAIRTAKRDALGRPAPGAKAWVKTNGNAVTQVWRITSVITADGGRIKLPGQGVTVTVHISNLEFAHLNALDASSGPPGANHPMPLRQDIDRLLRLRGAAVQDEVSYVASIVPKLMAAVSKHTEKLAKKGVFDDQWYIDSTCIEGQVAEVAERDTVHFNGMDFRVAVMTKGGVWGLPVDYALSAPRDEKGSEKFKALYGLTFELGKGVRLPVEVLRARGGSIRR